MPSVSEHSAYKLLHLVDSIDQIQAVSIRFVDSMDTGEELHLALGPRIKTSRALIRELADVYRTHKTPLHPPGRHYRLCLSYSEIRKFIKKH